MTISIRQALSNVASEKYNKTNVLIYSILYFLLGILLFVSVVYFFAVAFSSAAGGISHSIFETIANFRVLLFVLLAFISILYFGMDVIAKHNAIHGVQGVFPNLICDIKKIFINSLKVVAGNVIIATIFSVAVLIIPLIIVGLSSVNQFLGIILGFIGATIYALLAIPAVIAAIMFWMLLHLNFYNSLNFTDLINFKKAFLLLKMAKSSFFLYMLICILVSIVCSFISWVISFLSDIIYFIGIQSVYIQWTFGIVGFILTTVLWILSVLIYVDLTGQFMQETLEKRQISVSS